MPKLQRQSVVYTVSQNYGVRAGKKRTVTIIAAINSKGNLELFTSPWKNLEFVFKDSDPDKCKAVAQCIIAAANQAKKEVADGNKTTKVQRRG